MMSLVHDQARVRRQHGGLAPVARRASHGDVGEQQMMVHDDHVRLRRLAPGLEQEALVVERTARALAEVRLRRDFIPELGPRRRREIAERAIRGGAGPFGYGLELLLE